MANLDTRPETLDVKFRPGSTVTLNLNGPAGWLTTRDFTATLNGTALTVTESGDTLVVAASPTITGALSSPGTSYPLVIHRTGGNDALVGSWKASENASPATTVSAVTLIDSLDVAVTILGSGTGGGGGLVDSVVAGTNVTVDSTDPANPVVSASAGGGAPSGPAGGVLGGTYPNPSFAVDMATQAELDAEAVLARSADNLTSGTVADARIAATIARDSEVTSAIAALTTVYQPVDSDLTAIAALTTTTYGRSLLTQADAAATRTTLGLGTAATQNTSAFDTAGAAAAAQAASQPVDSDLTAIAALTTTTFGRGLLTLADAAAGRSTLGVVIGTNVQAWDADLDALAAIVPANDDFVQRKAGAWTNRTVAQVKTDLGLTGTNSGDQTITLTGDGTGSGTGSFALTLATVNSNVGTFGDASHVSQVTLDGKGRATSASSVSIAIANTAVSGLGTASTVNTGTTSGTIPLLSTGGVLPIARLATGTPDGTKFVRDDGTLVTPSGGGGGISALTGDATASGTGSVAITFATVNSNVGSFGDASHVTALTVNGKGLVTAAASTAIAIANTAVSGLGTASTVNTGTSGANVPTITLADARYAPIASQLKATAVKTANYTAAAGDLVPLDTTSGTPIVVTLPTAPADGTAVGIKWVLGANATSTYATGGSDTLNKTGGSTSGSLVQVNQEVLLRYASASGVWYVQTSFSKGGLDALYKPVPVLISTTSSATPSIAVGTAGADINVTITALAAAITSMTTNLTGTPVDFQKMLVRIKDDGTPRAITWGASYASKGATLPTTTVASKLMTVGLIYNATTSLWGCVAVAQEA